VVVALRMAACSAGDDDGGGAITPAEGADTTAAPSTELPSCDDARHMVVFDISGTITSTKEEVLEWLRDSSDEPEPRANAAALVAAYQERGYEILYVTGLPGTNTIGDVPVPEAMMGWLERNGFPVDGARVETSHTPDPPVELSNDLIALAVDGVTIDAAYTDNTDDVTSFGVGGVKEIYLLGEQSAGVASTSVPGDDLGPRLAEVEAMPPICG